MPGSFWRGDGPLILASGSAARRSLLESAGLPFEVVPATIDERVVEQPLAETGASPEAIALALARAKAVAVSAGRPGAVVLGGDQTLSLGSRMLHKPPSVAAAVEQLAALAGRTHQLASAVALVRDGAVLFEDVALARMTMRPLSAGFRTLYLEAMGEGVRSTVGGYQLEGLGIHLFETIEGDQATIMGLPLLRLLAGLRGLGLLAG